MATLEYYIRTLGTSNLRFAVYRGLNTGATLIGETASISPVDGRNTAALVAEAGENLDVTAGEPLVIAVTYGAGTNTTLWGTSAGPSGPGLQTTLAWFVASDVIGGFASSPPSGAQTTRRFAFALY